MEHVGVWVGIIGVALGLVVWVVKIAWQVRGVSDVANAAHKLAESATPRSECVLKEKNQITLLERIDKNLAGLWDTVNNLKIGERLSRIETDVDNLKKRVNGSGR